MSVFDTGSIFGPNTMITPEGGIARPYINGTGAASVKGTCVHMSGLAADTVIKTEQDDPDCIGVIYNNGVPDGGYVWVVFSGAAEVYFIDDVELGELARTFVAADTGFVAGQALAEPVPANPFAEAKHFAEIGHVLESRVGAGLALVNLHFN